jgi:SAM-dependent methyltransferase
VRSPERELNDPYFTSRYASDPARDTVWRAICRYLQPYVPVTGAVLDLGAGYCSFVNHVQARERHALDVSPELARHAGPGVIVHVGRCDDLSGFADGSFDVVFASNLLEHLEWPSVERTLDEARRVLKPGGRLLLLQPNFRYCARQYFDDYTHRTVFTHVGLADLLASRGFEVERVTPRLLPFSFNSRAPKWGFLVALYLRLPARPMARQMLVVARTRVRLG